MLSGRANPNWCCQSWASSLEPRASLHQQLRSLWRTCETNSEFASAACGAQRCSMSARCSQWRGEAEGHSNLWRKSRFVSVRATIVRGSVRLQKAMGTFSSSVQLIRCAAFVCVAIAFKGVLGNMQAFGYDINLFKKTYISSNLNIWICPWF